MQRFGDLGLDMVNGWLVVGSRRVNVSPAIGRLLQCLIRARGNSVTAAKIREAMRKDGHPEVSMENLRVGMSTLRAAMKRAGAVTVISNRIGYGWRLDVPRGTPHERLGPTRTNGENEARTPPPMVAS